MISNGNVITDAEKMDDLIEVMTGNRFGFVIEMIQCPVSGNRWRANLPTEKDIYDGPMGVFEGYGDYDH